MWAVLAVAAAVVVVTGSLLWGSVATILWRERCRGRGVDVRLAQFAAVGAVGVPLVLAGTWLALLATGV